MVRLWETIFIKPAEILSLMAIRCRNTAIHYQKIFRDFNYGVFISFMITLSRKNFLLDFNLKATINRLSLEVGMGYL